MTVIINVSSEQAGEGKSTVAQAIFEILKEHGIEVELYLRQAEGKPPAYQRRLRLEQSMVVLREYKGLTVRIEEAGTDPLVKSAAELLPPSEGRWPGA